MPSKNARSASAGSADDVDYYNVYINRQSFENAQPGTEIKSAPIVVGTQVTVTVEAYGQAKDETGATIMQNSRIAYYTTTLSMPSSPVSLNIKMSEYKTVWHKVTLNMNGFNGQTSKSEYIEDGSSYTLTDLGTYTPPQGVPQKHTGWRMYDGSGSDTPPFYPVGASVTITGDTAFELEYDTYATITFEGNQNFKYWDNNVQVLILPTNWKSTDYAEKGKPYTLTDYGAFAPPGGSPYKHIGWSYTDSSSVPQNVGSKAAVLITGDMTFTVEYAKSMPLGTGGNDIELNNSIYYDADKTKYYIWDEQPFTLPRRKKADGSFEDIEWTFSKWTISGTEISPTTWRSRVTVEYDDWKDWAQQVCGEPGMEIAPKN